MTLRDVCTTVQDGEHATVKRVENGKLFISARNIKADHQIILDTVTYVNEESYEKIRKRFFPQAGDILLTCAGTIGNSAIVPPMPPFVADRGLTMLRPKSEIISTKYLHACITSDYVQSQMKQNVRATALAHLYSKQINAIKVIVPPLSLQKQFSTIIEQADKSKYVAQKATKNIRTYGIL